MNEKLLETVRVDTYLKRVKCPNQQCDGFLESDGHSRTEGMLHGGPEEHRHHCTLCALAAWLKDKFPKVEYKVVPVEAAPTVVIPVSKKPIKVKGESVVQPTEQ